MKNSVVSIDPGTYRTGIAFVNSDGIVVEATVLESVLPNSIQRIIDVANQVQKFLSKYTPYRIVIERALGCSGKTIEMVSKLSGIIIYMAANMGCLVNDEMIVQHWKKGIANSGNAKKEFVRDILISDYKDRLPNIDALLELPIDVFDAIAMGIYEHDALSNMI